MYKILVVEDEDIIRQGLMKVISKLNLPFEHIFEACSGETALEIAKLEKPHIILTDIKMPEMDGLEFIRYAKSTGCTTVFIIISGFSDFSFAQKAISLGVSQYLLKPIVKADLYNILSNIIKDFEERAKIQLYDSTLKTNLLRKISKLQEQVLEQVLMGGYAPEKTGKELSDSEITFEGRNLLVLSSYFCKNKDQDPTPAFINELKKIMDIYYSCTTKYGYSIHLVNSSDEYAIKMGDINAYLEKCLTKLRCEYGVNGFVGISKMVNDPDCLRELVIQAEELLDYKNLYHTSRVFLYSDIKNGGIPEKVPELYYLAIYNALNSGSTGEITAGVDHLFRYMLGAEELCPKLFMDTISELFKHLQKSMSPEDAKKTITFINQMDPFLIYRSSESVSELLTKMKEVLLAVRDSLKETARNFGNNTIEYALKYIDENYDKNLTLDFISGLVFLNPNYFSTLFKEKTGLSFSHYLQKIRVEKAKKLLLDPRYKIYEIAEKTGFNDDKYFFKVFKKLTGISPNDYRNHIEENIP